MKKRSTLAMIAEDMITLAIVVLVLLAMTGGLDKLIG